VIPPGPGSISAAPIQIIWLRRKST
jgi:hypothetical protein